MLVGFSQQDLKNWNVDIHGYQKQKRTKKPFGREFVPSPNIVKSQVIKQKQSAFNPILQTYKSDKQESNVKIRQESQRAEELRQYYKTMRKGIRDFDIINLHGTFQKQKQKGIKSLAPIRNIYNPINNQPIPQYYFNNKDVILGNQRQFKSLKPEPRDFNIVTGIYVQDDQQKKQLEILNKNRKIQQKYKNTHIYDNVYGRFYDPQKQKQYEQNMAKSQLIHSSGQRFNQRFPPGYINREPVILDSSKPISQSLIDIDRKKQNAKQRYKLKYLIQRQYQQRNLEHQQKAQRMLKNRIYNSHSMDQKAKQMNLLSLYHKKQGLEDQIFGNKLNNSISRLQDKYNPQIQGRNQKLYSNSNSNYSEKSSRGSQRYSQERSIKSGGFY